MNLRRILPALLVLAACHSTSTEMSPWVERGGKVEHPELQVVCSDVWEWRMATEPIQATYLGDARYYGELELPGPHQREERRQWANLFLAYLEFVDTDDLRGEDRLTYEILREELELDRVEAALALDPESWNLDPDGGPQNLFLSLAPFQPVATEAEREALLERWEMIPSYISQCCRNLRRGADAGRFASRTAVDKTLAQLDRLLATPPELSPLVTCVPEGTRTRSQVLTFVRHNIYPAFADYRATIADEVVPHARSDEQPGIVYVDGGKEAYAVAIRRYTSLEKTAKEIHQIGLEQVARIRAAIQQLGGQVFGTTDFAEIQKKLRSDPALHFATREEVEAKAVEALARADAAAPRAFSLLPRVKCEVVRVPEHKEPETTIAYYQQPTADGSRIGRYYINTYAPATRPRYDAEVLAFHESVPGHHLQIALAFELDSLPPVRRYSGQNAYVEGWALYSEKLADELGLYSTDLDRLGMLSFDAWRASRLVVDTGIHGFGWSREQAIRYLADNTLLALNNAENEVDRYIAWPGQALGYMLGQLEIQRLRALAEAELGERFSLAEFHRQVLGHGPLTLGALDGVIARWIAEGVN